MHTFKPSPFSSLPLSGDMLPSTLMSKMLALLPTGQDACFFLQGAFLKRLPADVRGHLVHDRTMDPLSLALHADKIYQSQVSDASALNHISSPPVECPVLSFCIPPVSGSRFPPFSHSWSSPLPFTSTIFCLPPFRLSWLCWYYRNYTEQAQKCRSPCSWLGN